MPGKPGKRGMTVSRLSAFIKKMITFIRASLREFREVIGGESYYPGLKRKNRAERTSDLLKWFLKYREINRFYNLFGFDTHGIDESYINDNRFIKTRDRLNSGTETEKLRNKLLFFKLMSGAGMPVPNVFGVLKDGKFTDTDGGVLPLKELKERKDYFIKDIDGECASFVRHVEDFDDLCSQSEDFTDKILIMQERVRQCPEMNGLNPCAINTVRAVTVRTAGGIKVLAAVLRVGTRETGGVDNWAAGGISVGVKDDGFLEEYGLYKPGHGGRTDRHPDTGTVFSEFCIPGYEKIKEAVCSAHSLFEGVHSVGWDVAVTQDGPVFIEGNDNWEISLMQACCGGLRAQWDEACPSAGD